MFTRAYFANADSTDASLVVVRQLTRTAVAGRLLGCTSVNLVNKADYSLRYANGVAYV